uniref:Uncharacterized protein n=1 Tax=Romanomermis culicivorax TaxID=13658 RepID=A0A915KUK3_ROMCU
MAKALTAEQALDVLELGNMSDEMNNTKDTIDSGDTPLCSLIPIKRKVGQPPCSFSEPERKRCVVAAGESDDSQIEEQETNRSRWRQKSCRKDKERKRACSSGEAFINRKGKERSAKICQSLVNHVHSGKTMFKCAEFTEEQRKEVFTEYWKLGDNFKAKKNFLLSHTKQISVQRRQIKESMKKLKSYQYWLPKNGQLESVCREFFCKTLAISYKPIVAAHTKKNHLTNVYQEDDLRGKSSPANKLSNDVLEAVKAHIESFARVESHYCRKKTKRQYLDAKLSIARMYELFKEKNPDIIVSLQKYQEIFGTQYNLSFYKPRKDQCVQCSVYLNLKDNDPQKENLTQKHIEHMERKEHCRNAMKLDLNAAKDDHSMVVATMDLQSVLQIPQSAESAFYYKRKLCVYNLTFYVENERDGLCFLWSEVDGRRGSSEVGTAIKCFIEQQMHGKNFPNVVFDENNAKVNWLKIKQLKYFPSGAIEFKYDHEQENHTMKTEMRKRRGRQSGSSSWPKLYAAKLPISQAKKKDLENLCDMRLIPEEYQLFIKNLPVTNEEPVQSDEEGDTDEELL